MVHQAVERRITARNTKVNRPGFPEAQLVEYQDRGVGLGTVERFLELRRRDVAQRSIRI